MHESYGTFFQYNVKNWESNSTSCSDKCPTLVGSCGGHSLWRTSSDVFLFNLRLRFEGLFWERYILKGQIAFEGHWRLQSWTLDPYGWTHIHTHLGPGNTAASNLSIIEKSVFDLYSIMRVHVHIYICVCVCPDSYSFCEHFMTTT